MTFQRSVNITQAVAVEGDFASANPRFAVPSQMTQGNDGFAAGFRAGTGGVLIGRFAWADAATNSLLLNSGTGLPTGFIGRAGLAGLATNYFTAPGSATFFIPQGMGVPNVFSGGTFWAKNIGAGSVTVGMKAFTQNVAGAANGAIQFAAAGATIANFIETKWWAASLGLGGELIKMTSQPLG
jgi:hypothetical protein